MYADRSWGCEAWPVLDTGKEGLKEKRLGTTVLSPTTSVRILVLLDTL